MQHRTPSTLDMEPEGGGAGARTRSLISALAPYAVPVH